MRRQGRRSFHRREAVPHRFLHLLEGAHLDLARSLARDAELVGELREREPVLGQAPPLEDALTVLNERERRIFEARRLAEDPITFAELADEFGVSRERVRQIEVSAFEKVQNAVKHRVAAMATPAPLPVR